MSALNYLKAREWSTGNGQCPDCYGAPESWHGHPCYPDPESIGHEKTCSLASAIIGAGGAVIFKGSLTELPLGDRYKKGSAIWEERHSPEYIARVKKMNDEFDEKIFKILTREDENSYDI